MIATDGDQELYAIKQDIRFGELGFLIERQPVLYCRELPKPSWQLDK
jgi:hypothetical protein